MAISVGGRRHGAIADINVTPMADVMIVLLIIFMVATPLITRSPVSLPRAANPAEHAGERISVLVETDGRVQVDGAPVPAAIVGDWVAERSAGRKTVLVQADERASYADVARVLAACRMAGVAEIALATERR